MSTSSPGGGGGGAPPPDVPDPPAGPPSRPSNTLLDPLVGRTVLGRYEIVRRIGGGGMGSVYVARQSAVGREIALKVLRPELITSDAIRERFRREAAVIGRLHHPNTIQLIDYGETEDGLAVMATELLVGMPLNDRLRDRGPLTLAETLDLGIQVASALSEAHLVGLVHRDLKPANIFLVEVAGQTHGKVLDFGIARLMDEEATRLTSTGQVFGTPRYMSPEQAFSTGEVDARTDLYALGLILYECLVGQPPFVAQTSIQYLSAHSTQRPPKLRERYPSAPVALEQLIDNCLAKDPKDRPPSAAAIAEALRAIKRHLDLGGGPSADLAPVMAAQSAADLEAGRPSPLGVGGPSGGPTAYDPRTALPRPAGGMRRFGPVVLAGFVLLAALIYGAVALLGDRDSVIIASIDGGEEALDAVDGSAVVAVIEPEPGPATGAAAGPATGAAAGLATDATPGRAAERDGGAAEVRGADGAATPRTADGPGEARASKETREIRENRGSREMRDGRDLTRKKTGHPRDRVPVHPGPHDATPLGDGVITGPATLRLDTSDDGGKSVVKLARDCKAPVVSGAAKLTLSGCPKGCAIILDEEKCAGRTPATDLGLPPGFHELTVICGKEKRLERQVQLVGGETRSFACR